jgi:AcrR family transcriptional regulator
MSHSKAGKTNAEASQESRDALLLAGTELLAEEAKRNPFATIALRDLCKRAGRSTGTFYVHWKSAEAFQLELARGLLVQSLGDDFIELKQFARDTSGQPGAESILALAERDIEMLLSNRHWDAIELLNTTWARTTSLREPAASGYRAMDQLTGETYDMILQRLGREPRPPLTVVDLGGMLQALVEGFGLRAKVDPDGMSLQHDTAQQRYAVAVAAVLAILTRPIGDRRSTNEALADALTS